MIYSCSFFIEYFMITISVMIINVKFHSIKYLCLTALYMNTHWDMIAITKASSLLLIMYVVTSEILQVNNDTCMPYSR